MIACETLQDIGMFNQICSLTKTTQSSIGTFGGRTTRLILLSMYFVVIQKVQGDIVSNSKSVELTGYVGHMLKFKISSVISPSRCILTTIKVSGFLIAAISY